MLVVLAVNHKHTGWVPIHSRDRDRDRGRSRGRETGTEAGAGMDGF